MIIRSFGFCSIHEVLIVRADCAKSSKLSNKVSRLGEYDLK